ncbi:MAG: hypothetical protein GXO79_03940 [Chlorobi bacterium]|nr:hypothetical protein [Chlorobiota bacterium]
MKKYLFYLLVSFTFFACNKNNNNESTLPENIIQVEGLQNVWNWVKTINLAKNDTIIPNVPVTYTFTEDGLFYDTEDSIKNNTYHYYVTSETQIFDNNTFNKLYLYFGDTKVLEKYIYLPNPSSLVIYDGYNYIYKGIFVLKE